MSIRPNYKMAALTLTVLSTLAFAQVEVNTIIEISSYADLVKIGTAPGYPLSGLYALTSDIDASASRGTSGGRGFAPIGRQVKVADRVNPDSAFTGSFDGRGHAISGLYVRRTAAGEAGFYAGLFGFALGADIRGVRVAADTVAGYRYVGALVGLLSGGVVEGCNSVGAVEGDSDVGGLVGALEGGAEVRYSYSLADVGGVGAGDVGGLVGSSIGGSKIAACYSAGSVSVASGVNVGGLVGSLDVADVANCYSVASVRGGAASAVGGLIGRSTGGTVQGSYSVGAVVGGAGGVGGLIGSADNSSVAYSFWDVERSGLSASAGGSLGVTGLASARMMDTVPLPGEVTIRNLVVDNGSLWGISNSYPYFKDARFPICSVTVRAGLGGALSGGGAVHVQKFNQWSGGREIVAIVADFSEGLSGWYIAGGDAEGGVKLAEGEYDGFSVAKISDDGTTLSLSGISSDVSIEARFVLKKYTLKYVARDNGRVVLDGGDDDDAVGTLEVTAEYGTVVTVRAVPNVGYAFFGWVVDGEKGAIRADTARAGHTEFHGLFIVDTLTLRYVVDAEGCSGCILRVNDGALPKDEHEALVAYGAKGPKVEAISIDPDYRFVKWSDERTDNPRVDTLVTAGLGVAAIFEAENAVRSIERVVPSAKQGGGAFVAMPIAAAGGELTLGPNPAIRQVGGGVDFYWRGGWITGGFLLIFDANGNLVNKITIDGSDGADGTSKRKIASWGLTDARGKVVRGGSYLVRGTLLTKGGKRERAGVMIGVR